MRAVRSGVFRTRNFEIERIICWTRLERLKSLENEDFELLGFESFEFESGREFGVPKFAWESSLEV